MSPPPADPTPQNDDDTKSDARDAMYSWARVNEKWKTIRLTIICVAVLFGLWMVIDAVRDLAEVNPWVTIVTILASLAAPSVLFWRIKGKFRAYFQKDHQRVIDLEAQVDVSRESSGLSTEGCEPRGEP